MRGALGWAELEARPAVTSKSRLMHARAELGCAIHAPPDLAPRSLQPKQDVRDSDVTTGFGMAWPFLPLRGERVGTRRRRKHVIAGIIGVSLGRLTTHGEESWQGGTRMSWLHGGGKRGCDSGPASGLCSLQTDICENGEIGERAIGGVTSTWCSISKVLSS